MKIRTLFVATVAVIGMLSLAGTALAREAEITWAATWQASPEPARAPIIALNNQTVRQIVRVSLGGNKFRVRLTNEYGDTPLRIGSAHVAIADSESAIKLGSDKVLTFSGAREVIIPEHAYVLSDPVDITLASLGQIAISLYVPGNERTLTEHYFAMQRAYIAPRDLTGSTTLPGATTITKRLLLSGVDVAVTKRTKVVVALGDSTTGGFGSTPDTDRRWTDRLSERLAASKKTSVSIVNAGIGGNRLLHDFLGPNALSRFDRDVLSQAGVTHVIVMIGINDFGLPGGRKLPQEEVTLEQMVAGFRQLIARAHERGVRIYAATLTPFGPIPERPGYYSENSALKRDALNQWIRTSKEFDGVIDFDAALRDPGDSKNLLAAYDSGDHLSPNDDGYKAMADAVDLKLID